MNKNLVQRLHSFAQRSYCYKSVRRPKPAEIQNMPDAAKQNLDTTESASKPLKTATDASTNLTKQIRNKILATGPITVAEYMREVLTSPQGGYYMQRDVFGREGDFVTSPEISQIFGELIGIWLITEWRKMGSPTPFQLVELGPGRGTLSRDILNVLTKFKLAGKFSMHLVEISPHLSTVQAQRFCYNHKCLGNDDQLPYYQVGETATGTEAFWYRRLEDVPQAFSFVLAHEFFDALPVHKLQLVNGVWKEILIDVNESSEKQENSMPSTISNDFRYVISKAQTPISQFYKPRPEEARQCLEYSLETDRLVAMLAERLEQHGGIGLIMDYGHFGDKTDTFRAFKKHKLHDPLVEPGTADLTADVDFQRIQHIAEQQQQVVCYGPVEQGDFLKRMQGDVRLEQLLQNAKPENASTIKSGYEMLTSAQQMGKRFKFLSMFPAVMKQHLQKFPVTGFS